MFFSLTVCSLVGCLFVGLTVCPASGLFARSFVYQFVCVCALTGSILLVYVVVCGHDRLSI